MTSRLTVQQLAEYEALIQRTTPVGAATAAPGIAAAMLAEIRRLQHQRKFLFDQITKKDAASGAGGRALAEFLGAEPDIAAADNPTPLRWSLNDVLWGDDDSVIVLLSGPDREPYWLELDPEHAAVLREDLAGPAEPEPEPRRCGRTRGVSGVYYRPCARDAGHPEAYCRSADGEHLFLAGPAVPAAPETEA
ncbi:hypothetical protein ACIQ7D_17970 [Streptomyces sp. NPDC096310]|uniref:hypothetical protein n=1 Tax=Streptomyces sp. NPDC096310 TaxID=3366082 RepID=UPI0037FB0A0E